MECCNTCICFKDPRRAFVGIGFVSMLLSLIQILVTVAVYTGSGMSSPGMFSGPMTPNVIVYELYIALSVLDFIILIFALVLLCGNERTDPAKAKCYFMPWIILLPFYVMYESAINIYYFYYQFNGGFVAPLKTGNMGFAIVPLIYWVIKDLFLIYGWMYVCHHFQHYCPCRPVSFHTSAPQVATNHANNVYFQGTTVAIPDSSCKTCGAHVSASSPVASPSCGCNSGFKIVQQTPMMQAPAVRYSQYVDVPAQPMYGCGNQMGVGSNTKAAGWTSSAYNGFFNRNN